MALTHAIDRATLPDVRRAIERLAATGYLIPESPLYRNAGAPIGSMGRTKSARMAALVGRGAEREEARARVNESIGKGSLQPVERRFTTQTVLEREAHPPDRARKVGASQIPLR